MRLLVYILLIVGLVAGYLPYFPVQEEGSIEAYSCSEINCSTFTANILGWGQARCAFYEINDPLIMGAVDDDIILVFDEEYDGFGTPVASEGLMHHKYCIINESIVFTGSMNPTINGVSKNNNYVVLVKSKKIAQNYLHNFYELAGRVVETNNPYSYRSKVILSGRPVKNYFCPGCEEHVIDELRKATESIRVLAFTLTSEPIIKELNKATLRGVDVQVVFEKRSISQHSGYNKLLGKRYIDGNPYTMHEKLIVIDNATVILGSYNPTGQATQRNDENILIVRGLALWAENEFKKVREKSILGEE